VSPVRQTAAILLSIGLLAFASCGGGGDDKEASQDTDDAATGTFNSAIRDAQAVRASDFPSAKGKTLQQLAETLPSINVGLATSVFTPGRNRLAFGLIDGARKFVYGKTALYLARNPNAGSVIGPIPAPADPLVVKPPFRSRGAALADDDIAAIYEAQVDLPKTGRWYVLAMNQSRGQQFGAAFQIDVARSSPIPASGEPAPKVRTDTRASAGGDIGSIDTRVPPDDMHDTDFRKVVGKKPVALLFATPQLCQTRVCGPVVDIAAQLKSEYGDRIEFIHQEVYVDNQVKKGLRPPLQAFDLRTEPWLFTIDKQGRVAASLEGSFGNGGFERAIQAAL
jgi:hypothetical protein